MLSASILDWNTQAGKRAYSVGSLREHCINSEAKTMHGARLTMKRVKVRLRRQVRVLSSLASSVLFIAAIPQSAAQTPGSAGSQFQPLQDKVAAQDKAEEASRTGNAQRLDPGATDWIKYLDPVPAGGWVFRGSAGDGSWALFTSKHQRKRIGQVVTLWLRWEQFEQQTGPAGIHFMSYIEKVEYDCGNDRARTLAQITYPKNNLKGDANNREFDPKTSAWELIAPGTQGENNLQFACTKN
jgi:hypothetical protein